MGNAKTSFFRLFVGGFVAGIIGMVALQPAEAGRALGQPFQVATQR